MGRLRTRQSVVLLCIAVVVFAAIMPTVAASLGAAIFTALWLIPAASLVVIRRSAISPRRQAGKGLEGVCHRMGR